MHFLILPRIRVENYFNLPIPYIHILYHSLQPTEKYSAILQQNIILIPKETLADPKTAKTYNTAKTPSTTEPQIRHLLRFNTNKTMRFAHHPS